MAQVHVEHLVDHLTPQLQHALMVALAGTEGGQHVYHAALWKAFRRAITRNFSTWQQVPNELIEEDLVPPPSPLAQMLAKYEEERHR